MNIYIESVGTGVKEISPVRALVAPRCRGYHLGWSGGIPRCAKA